MEAESLDVHMGERKIIEKAYLLLLILFPSFLPLPQPPMKQEEELESAEKEGGRAEGI